MESAPRVCIVTSELLGLHRNGGIGTAMTGLAETLAAAGMPVTVLYTGGVWTPLRDLPRWKKHYAERGIALEALSLRDMAGLAGPVRDIGLGIPPLVYQWLKSRPFDVVHFNENSGDGYLALSAKRLGIAFDKTLMVVALHSPTQWVLEQNAMLPPSPLYDAFDRAERISVAAADVVWSPSRYMLDWVRAHGFTTPETTFVRQYAIPLPPVRASRTTSIDEIVFFGRLEERKGLRLFCDAIDALRPSAAIIFLGKPAKIDGVSSVKYVARRMPRARIITNLGQAEALRYLSGEKRLAVMASPADNSPCTVYEALECGFPFLAARTGGIPELVDNDDVLFSPEPRALAAALARALDGDVPRARPAVSQSEIRAEWIEMHREWRSLLPSLGVRGIVEDTTLITAPTATARPGALDAMREALARSGADGIVAAAAYRGRVVPPLGGSDFAAGFLMRTDRSASDVVPYPEPLFDIGTLPKSPRPYGKRALAMRLLDAHLTPLVQLLSWWRSSGS